MKLTLLIVSALMAVLVLAMMQALSPAAVDQMIRSMVK